MIRNGFTKIEVLIIIILVLILIVANIVFIFYLNSKLRDIRVLSEINQIRSSLEIFLLVNNQYPEANEPVSLNDRLAGTEKLCLSGFKKITDNCQKNILRPIPNQYLSEGNIYIYKSTEDNQNYQIAFTLKTNFRELGLSKGQNCATNSQLTSQPCF